MNSAYIKYIIAMLLFGSNGVIASYIPLNSYEIVLSRTLIGSLFLILVFAVSKGKFSFWQNKKNLLFLAISGFALGSSWMLLYEAYAQIGVSLATLAYYCGPVIVMILAPFVFGEKSSPTKVLGFIIVVLGMILVNGAGIMASGMSWGLACAMLSACMYAMLVLANKKVVDISGLENSVCQLVVGCLVVAIFTLLKHDGGFNLTIESLLPMLFLGIVNTGIGCYLYFSAIHDLSAQSVSIGSYLEPLSALIFAALFLQEHLTGWQLIGAACILGGAAFGELYKRRKNTSVSSADE